MCFTSVTPARIRSLPCGHCLHKGCALRWLARSRTCPLCRQLVPLRPSQILRKAFRRRGFSKLCLNLPAVVKEELREHPDGQRAKDLAFLTADVVRYLAALRGMQL